MNYTVKYTILVIPIDRSAPGGEWRQRKVKNRYELTGAVPSPGGISSVNSAGGQIKRKGTMY